VAYWRDKKPKRANSLIWCSLLGNIQAVFPRKGSFRRCSGMLKSDNDEDFQDRKRLEMQNFLHVRFGVDPSTIISGQEIPIKVGLQVVKKGEERSKDPEELCNYISSKEELVDTYLLMIWTSENLAITDRYKQLPLSVSRTGFQCVETIIKVGWVSGACIEKLNIDCYYQRHFLGTMEIDVPVRAS
jgi:hypothetical protein